MSEIGMFLTENEIIELTQRRYRNAQVQAITQMGIDHKVRPDGSVTILREHIQKMFSGETVETKRRKKSEPDFSEVK